MSETNVNKRKAKGKWHQQYAKKRKFSLCPDLKGFLLFCNCKERETIREAYVLLNQFADRMYGSEVTKDKVRQPSICKMIQMSANMFFCKSSFSPCPL